MKKRCPSCKKEKNLNQFNINRRNKKTGRNWRCKACVKIYLETNKEKLYADHKVWYKKNRDREIQRVLDWRIAKYGDKKPEREKKKVEKEIERLKKLKFKKYKNEFLTPVSKAMRVYLWMSFKRNRYSNVDKYPNLIGCSFEYLKKHIENQFLKDMAWVNKGLWETDHIIPLSSAKTVDELYKLFHYSNIQPLWKIDHKKKTKLDFTFQ